MDLFCYLYQWVCVLLDLFCNSMMNKLECVWPEVPLWWTFDAFCHEVCISALYCDGRVQKYIALWQSVMLNHNVHLMHILDIDIFHGSQCVADFLIPT